MARILWDALNSPAFRSFFRRSGPKSTFLAHRSSASYVTPPGLTAMSPVLSLYPFVYQPCALKLVFVFRARYQNSCLVVLPVNQQVLFMSRDWNFFPFPPNPLTATPLDPDKTYTLYIPRL